MAVLRSKEIRQLNEKDFQSKLGDIRKELLKLRAQKSAGSTPENPGRIRALRRTIARMITIKGGSTEKQ
ncbi:50S ribosomal protein L29 [Candidatus Woesearchaeota archaeon]|jgi:large subunit ribosomal protein L29|nr:50S ribosomal protein L29 [Candidatus Woesearchaeota archaeon]MBT4114754.1 50S ribosomal protein L29 [Candidatus Woesearchaeota archaeon]MBT4248127.1 50S ribosomal protein L29 [Candidatus Woesearchaeota archaeon]